MLLTIGFFLDLCFGDPYWMPHPVRLIGKLIQVTEKLLRKCFPKTKRGELAGGACLTTAVLVICGVSFWGLWQAAEQLPPTLAFGMEAFLCYQMLAAKSLKKESMKVYDALHKGDTEEARHAVSMIVGRDTSPLNRAGIIRAAVETVAENTSDGVIAPLFYMALGGAPLALLYKAVNTMDSMVGYRNESYLYFGRCGARLDDLANLIPARLSALLMIAASWLLGMDGRGAIRVFKRDRYSHKSPNSAQTEAVCAGALQVQLAGNAYYFGKLCEKPTIGDDIRPVEAEDIPRANRLMLLTAWLMLLLIWLMTAVYALFF